jgi:hypothetical protein
MDFSARNRKDVAPGDGGHLRVNLSPVMARSASKSA